MLNYTPGLSECSLVTKTDTIDLSARLWAAKTSPTPANMTHTGCCVTKQWACVNMHECKNTQIHTVIIKRLCVVIHINLVNLNYGTLPVNMLYRGLWCKTETRWFRKKSLAWQFGIKAKRCFWISTNLLRINQSFTLEIV